VLLVRAVLVQRHAELVHRQLKHTEVQRSSLIDLLAAALKDILNTSYAHRHVQLETSSWEEYLQTYAPMCVCMLNTCTSKVQLVQFLFERRM